MKKSNRTVELRAFLRKNKPLGLEQEVEALIDTISPQNGHALEQLMTFAEDIFKKQPDKSILAVDLVDLFRHHDLLNRSESCEKMISNARLEIQQQLKEYMYGCELENISRFLQFEKSACIAIDKRITSERNSLIPVRFSNPSLAEEKNAALNVAGIDLLKRKDSYSAASKAYKRWQKKLLVNDDALAID